jgi:hypothetical protein
LYYKYATRAVPKGVSFNLINLAINMADPKLCVARTAELQNGKNGRTAEQQYGRTAERQKIPQL